jgi:formate dehydrogenase major subunit
VIEPLFESMPDHAIMQAFAEKLGFANELSKNYKLVEVKRAGRTWREPETESILREINAGNWTIGYTGQSPERLKAHMRNMHMFDVRSLRWVARTRSPAMTSPVITSACHGRATARRS